MERTQSAARRGAVHGSRQIRAAAPRFGAESRGQTRREEFFRSHRAEDSSLSSCCAQASTHARTAPREERVLGITHGGRSSACETFAFSRWEFYLFGKRNRIKPNQERERERASGGCDVSGGGGASDPDSVPGTTCPASVGKRRAFLPSEERARIK